MLVCSGFNAASALEPPKTGNMDQLVQSYVDHHKFMGSAIVARDGKILLDKGYGFANLEWDIPNSPQTKFRLGSVTKQFTAASILLLEERRELRIDERAGKYLSDLPKAWDKITIYNLLTHTAGIPNFTNFPDYKTNHASAVTPGELLKRFIDRPLEFPPGEKFAYSNSGYIVLGMIIEKVSGQTYGTFVQDNIFTPLAMHDSGYDSNNAIIKHRASGYSFASGSPKNASYVDMTVPFAAGGLYSTVEDMLKWENGLFEGKLLTQASLTKMTTPFKGQYALGVGVHKMGERTIVEHAGGVDGFVADAAFFPEEKLAIVVLSNQEDSSPTTIAKKLADIAHGKQAELQREWIEVTIPATTLKSYVGKYQLPDGPEMVITLDNGTLFARFGEQPKLQLRAEEESKFFIKELDAQFEFIKSTSGAAPYLIMHQGGQDIKALMK